MTVTKFVRLLVSPLIELLRVGASVVRFVILRWPNSAFGFWMRRRYAIFAGALIGKNTQLHRGCDVTWDLVSIGRDSGLAEGVIIALGPERMGLVIGDDTWIGPGTYMRNMNHGFSLIDVPIMKQPNEGREIVIGSGVWLGARCIVLAGAKIGDHSVAAAGSVISSEIPPYSVVAGNPARVVRKRKTS